MPEVSFGILIAAVLAALGIGFIIAYLLQSGKISAAVSAEAKKREELLLSISEKEKALAVMESQLQNEKKRLEETEVQNAELIFRANDLSESLHKAARGFLSNYA